MPKQIYPTSFEDACQVCGYDPATCLPSVTSCPEGLQAAILAVSQIMIVREACNRIDNDGQPWAPDWNNWDERKYYPWFDLEVTEENGSGFRFDGSGYGVGVSRVGSRLCFKTREASDHAGKQFLPLYRDLMVIEK